MSDFINDQGDNSQGQGDSPFNVFSDPFQMMEEDGGLIQPSSFFENQAPAAQPDQQNEPNPQAPVVTAPVIGGVGDPNPAGTPNPEPKVKFDDELVNKYAQKQSTDELSEEELIQRLQQKGYSAPVKEEEKSEDFVENQELQRLNNELQNAENFLKQPDAEVIRIKSRDELIKKYQSLGKAHLVGTEDFEIDLEATVEEITQSEHQAKMYAESIRNGIATYKNNVEAQKQNLNTKRQEKRDQAVAQSRLKLQGSLENIVSGGKFFGVDVNTEQALEVYNEITSGEFTKTVNSNPDLVAKFAFFTKNLEAIESLLGGATYGQGVKDTVTAIRDKGTQQSRSPISAAINSSQAQGGANRLDSWKLPTIEDDQKQPDTTPKYVAGRGG
jgi:hypothetical protein